jgi:RsiW-degrading membrane proteinase PrsW (M82 family)
MQGWANFAAVLVLCFSPSLFWLAYFVYRNRVGRRLGVPLVVVFLGGLVAGPLSLGIFRLLELAPFYQGLTSIYEVEPTIQFAWCMFAIGPVEELAKFLMVWLLVYRRSEFERPLDGLVYSTASALGFATIENWYYMVENETFLWTRAVTLPFNHVLFSSFWGVGLSYGRFGVGAQRRQMVAVGLVLSIVYHGLYDYILVAEPVPDLMVLPLVFALWLWVSTAQTRIQRKRRLSGLTIVDRGPDPDADDVP